MTFILDYCTLHEINIKYTNKLKKNTYNTIVLAVPHMRIMRLGIKKIESLLKNKSFIYDKKGVLKKKKKIITIGLAFDFQELFSIPVSKYDQKLDYIITNKNILQWKFFF